MLGAVQGAAAGQSKERLSQIWRDFGAYRCGAYSPLYAAICRSVADDPDLLALTAAAPPAGQQPNVLLAAVHYLVLSGLAHPLAENTPAGLTRVQHELFRDLCLAHRPTVSRILGTRHTQTNEPGRAALLAVGLAAAADPLGEPVGLLDAGCSAGLNLLIDRYRFDWPAAWARRARRCRSAAPCAAPAAGAAAGHRRPAGPGPGTSRCHPGRRRALAARLRVAGHWAAGQTAAAIELARHPPPVRSGDMVTDLDAALGTFDPGLPVVVVTTSACWYLSVPRRQAFLAVLARRARRQRLAWLSVDTAGVVNLGPVQASPPVPRQPVSWGWSPSNLARPLAAPWPGVTRTAPGWTGWPPSGWPAGGEHSLAEAVWGRPQREAASSKTLWRRPGPPGSAPAFVRRKT